MYLHRRQTHRPEGVGQSDAGVGVPAGIENDAVAGKPCVLHRVDEVPLMVGLVKNRGNVRFPAGFLCQGNQVVVGVPAVNFRLPQTQQIQVGAV